MLIDIHTHASGNPETWVLGNIYKNFSEPPAGFYSAGLHPWFIETDTWRNELQQVKELANSSRMLAVGECGLDRICATDYNLQKEVFEAQIRLANELDKPLILHCVRAHEEMLQILAVNNNRVPTVFHGFNRGQQLAEKIIEKGYCLSFGKALQHQRVQHILAGVPPGQFFLETDGEDISIDNIYDYASAARNLSREHLLLQIQQNVQSVFKIKI